MAGSSYQDLVVWQKGFALAVECYRLTRRFPQDEMYGLTSQIRRAATSVPTNIAEGWGRTQPKDYVRFLRIAQGSLKELETLLLLSEAVEITSTEDISCAMELTAAISRMLRALVGTLTATTQ